MSVKSNLAPAVLLCAGMSYLPSSWAHDGETAMAKAPTPDSHAPMGVMGDHTHRAGEWMVSYRYMTMAMKGNQQGTNSLSPEEIATTIANPFAGQPMMPPTLRVVPLEMTTQMHMVGLMYAPTDRVTLMAMAHYLDKDMEHVTFAGGMGSSRLGHFTTRSSGWGDTQLSALIGLYDGGAHRWHLNAGISLPTGSIDEEDNVLTPMGMRPTLRLPYAMQLGSGTYDLEPGITYNGGAGKLTWGGQYRATIRLGENNEDYTLGDKHQLTGWGAYRVLPWMSGSLRLTGRTEGKIDGRDSGIMAPVQTADPDNYGGDFVDLSLGANLVGRDGPIRGHRLGVEWTVPVYQDYNGVQMDMDWMLLAGYQYSW
ncbi:hypothetical protein [Marinobacter sp. SS21]|uniref:hypothetical protein n=1 Tax=Marinobacter sp. SS21 TaxID=2979460 RepID=UPI00232D0C81|nr:hypothetical protein [Marinobacter sp. SS21]MDC0662512.1 hypothetical protein [Marinobacter sp. SS21]